MHRRWRGGVFALMAIAAVSRAQTAPATEDPAPAAEKAVVRETGFTEEAARAAVKKAVPAIEFSAPATGDGRRRVFGTVAKARMPMVELLGAPEDLVQVAAISPLVTPLGPASIETSPFAAAVLDFAAPDWPERKEWLKAALKKVAESNADHQVFEDRGRLRISFSAWQRMGFFRLVVETAQGATARAAAMSKSGLPGAGDKPAPAPKPAEDAGTAHTPGAPPKLETKADGATLVDGKYTLKGKGTKEEPYQVTWDQLVSAQDDYIPKEGKKEIPGRIAMLDGKWVQLTGYVAFPLMVDEADECLSMMNQWDGCCIGIPPTPYDAVEVRLTEVAKGDMRMTTFGSVKGKFKVDPHLVGGWLVGLYVMDQTTLTPQGYGGFAP